METRSRAAARKRPKGSPGPGHTLGLDEADVVGLARKLKQGLPYRTVVRLQERTGLSLDLIAKVTRIPRRTLARRRSTGVFTAEESERIYRLAAVFERAVELFEGDPAAARRWMTTPSRALSGLAPLEMSDTEVGAREVEDFIGRLEHGVFV